VRVGVTGKSRNDMPSVEAIWRFWRDNPPFEALVIDQPACFLCEEPERGRLERHHITPMYRGGTNDLSNLILLCGLCHRAVPNDAALMRRWLRIAWEELGWVDPRSQQAQGFLLLLMREVDAASDFLTETQRVLLLRQMKRRMHASPHFALAELAWKIRIMRHHRARNTSVRSPVGEVATA
jgi:hypothetical protein